MRNHGLVKSIKFKNYKYIGDPINAIRIFNEKEVDELILLDIDKSNKNQEPDYKIIEQIASECFMPLGYGGGITNIEIIKNLFSVGVEKVILNSSIFDNPGIIKDAANIFGSQSIVASVDVKKNIFGKYEVYSFINREIFEKNIIAYVDKIISYGAGEIFLNSVNKDGMMDGYDYKLLSKVCSIASIPVIACGGAGKIEHFSEAVRSGASAVAAGSIFIYHGPLKAVLINYPSQEKIMTINNG